MQSLKSSGNRNTMKRTWLLYGILPLFVFAADRITKWYVCAHAYHYYPIMPHVWLHCVFNRGISWSMLTSTQPILYGALTGAIGLFLLFFMLFAWLRYKDNHCIIGELLVISGGISNLIDRCLYEGVIDFILISWDDWSFPIFNIADCAIVLGVFVICYNLLFE
jgi:signal peptidase II